MKTEQYFREYGDFRSKSFKKMLSDSHKKHWVNGTYSNRDTSYLHTDDYRKLRSTLMKNKWSNGDFEGQSKKIAEGIASGRIKTHNKLSGYYKKVWFDSAYELMRMVYYDENKIKWKRCDWVISYVRKGKIKYYVPDFEVKYGNITVIEEVKPMEWSKTPETLAKKRAIEEFIKDDPGFKYKIITEKTLFKHGNYNEFKKKARKLIKARA